MQDPERKIPYNYTSAGDEQVIAHLFGSGPLKAVQRFDRENKISRFSRRFYRLTGDLFVIERNSFLFRELVDDASLRRQLFSSFQTDLAAMNAEKAAGTAADAVLDACRQKIDDLSKRLDEFHSRRHLISSALSPIAGKDNIYFDAFNLTAHTTDATDWRRYAPVAVVRPDNDAQVPQIVKKVRQLGFKLIPRGAGTGLTGGATPLAPACIMLNTEKLDTMSPIEFDRTRSGEAYAKITVGAGVITQHVIDHADKNGFIFATDPTSSWACTIGGNLAENAGGKKAVLFGTAIDNILSYTIALPQGEVFIVKRKDHPLHKIRPEDRVEFDIFHPDGPLVDTIALTGEDIRKKGLGKDVTHKTLNGLLGLQKEGCDGIITQATFLLYPKFSFSRTVCIEFFGNDMAQAGRVIEEITRAFPGSDPALMALEHFDEEYIKAIRYKTKTNVGSRIIAVLLLDLVSNDADAIENGLSDLESLLEGYDKTGFITAADEEEAQRYWLDRKKLGAIAAHTNAFKLNEDIVLPIASLADFAAWVDDCNIAEKKFNQERIFQNIVEYLDAAEPISDFELFQRRAGQAKDLAYRTRKKLEIASRDAIEAYIHAKNYLREVLDSLRGFSHIAEGVAQVYDQTFSRLIVIATHMHAGDGNVHVNIPVLSDDREMMGRAHMTADRVMKKAVELSGVVSGEHGIGITKIKHLDPDRIRQLEDYRQKIDPDRLMNPCKLSDPDIMDKVFTPSFNLLDLEARILEHGSMSGLAKKVAGCVRCGKCKVSCPVFNPAQNMFFHPRNKNLAVGSLVEAVLYLVQRTHSTRFGILRHLASVADHCTICHKCLEQCPVNIDSGEISITEREILDEMGFKKTALPTRAALSYLSVKGKKANTFARTVFLDTGTRIQRVMSKIAAPVIRLDRAKQIRASKLLAAPAARIHPKPLSAYLGYAGKKQATILEPSGPAAATVFYFPGCGSEKIFSDISLASVYLLLENKTRVVLPPSFMCCGYPFLVNAKTSEFKNIMLENVICFSQIRAMFEDIRFDAVIVSCGTCMEALEKTGIHQIFNGPLTDISKYILAQDKAIAFEKDYLYHAPCHDSLKSHAPDMIRPLMGDHRFETVPYCCSEGGTLSLSRPDISHAMLMRKKKTTAVYAQKDYHRILTNCPSCLQGLSRLEHIEPVHLAQEMAVIRGGNDWKEKLKALIRPIERITF